jgi:hypothetical protein
VVHQGAELAGVRRGAVRHDGGEPVRESGTAHGPVPEPAERRLPLELLRARAAQPVPGAHRGPGGESGARRRVRHHRTRRPGDAVGTVVPVRLRPRLMDPEQERTAPCRSDTSAPTATCA